LSTGLFLHGREIFSVFELLGSKENDITYSLGWALARSNEFRQVFLGKFFPQMKAAQVAHILLQEATGKMGITDVELIGDELHVIIEAKKGWELPTSGQLRRYAPRFQKSGRSHAMFVTMSESSKEYASIHLPQDIRGVPVHHLDWKEIVRMTLIKNGTHAEKRLLAQFRTYLERIMKMQDQESNLVYVVSLGGDTPSYSTLSWRDIVNQRRRYFHPVGGKWPKKPPNYLGFRYDGCLQSIHHVDEWEIVTNMHNDIPEISAETWEPHFLYALGQPIIPTREVKTGNIYPSGRVWAMLDLLLTCGSVSEARDKTKERQNASY
jgi:hypothetical protein